MLREMRHRVTTGLYRNGSAIMIVLRRDLSQRVDTTERVPRERNLLSEFYFTDREKEEMVFGIAVKFSSGKD